MCKDPNASLEKLKADWLEAARSHDAKIIVLDDDPTGTQTVHSIPVYTSWSLEAMEKVRGDASRLVYVLTNSRSLSPQASREQHAEIAANLKAVFAERGEPFIVMSRSDSTLRGHFPLETRTLYDGLKDALPIQGEIIAPFFLEGGRITKDDVHFVREENALIPAAETEFAQDPAFGYRNSNLKRWVEEKTNGEVKAGSVQSVSLEMLRCGSPSEVASQLLELKDFGKLIVNAEHYSDLWAFYLGLKLAWQKGHTFLFRSAAALVQVLGGVEAKPLLNREQMLAGSQPGPGLVVVGSFVPKSTRQFQALQSLEGLEMLEWRVAQAASPDSTEAEAQRVAQAASQAMAQGRDACIYTSREFSSGGLDSLTFSARVSAGLCQSVRSLSNAPAWMVAKGGITSSDLAVKALGVDRALVLGQILPGIPVWRLGKESRQPNLAYVVFPGNVGGDGALAEAVNILRG